MTVNLPPRAGDTGSLAEQLVAKPAKRCNGDAATVRSWLECCRHWGPLFSAVLLFNSVFCATHFVLEPTLRSWVFCAEAEGPTAASFSGSARCGDQRFVVQRAAREAGMLQALEGFLGLLAVPVLGALGDRRGRIPVLRGCMVGYALSLAVISVSGGNRALLLGAFAVRGLTGGFAATFHAILGDRGGDRSLSFAVKTLVALAGQAFGWAASVWTLQLDLLDYMQVWCAMLGVFLLGCMAGARIPESLQEVPRPAVCLSIIAEPLGLLRDPFLRLYFAAQCTLLLGVVVFFLLRSFVLVAFEWQQGRFELLLGLVGALGCVSVACAPLLARRWTKEGVVLRSSLLGAIAVTLLCFAPLASGFCVASVLVGSLGFGGVAASASLLADRYPQDQGKVQALGLAVTKAAGSLGHLLYSWLFQAQAVGISQARPFFVAAVLGWLGYGSLVVALRRPQPTAEGPTRPPPLWGKLPP